MAKAKGQGGKKGEDRRKGRAPLSETGPTKPTTFRISPGGLEAILTLNERLKLGSQAGSIETACAQLLDALERADANPPLSPDQLALAIEAVRAARVNPRVLGPTARFGVVLVAAVMAFETMAVPAKCSAGDFAVLIEKVRRFTSAESLWLMALAVGE